MRRVLPSLIFRSFSGLFGLRSLYRDHVESKNIIDGSGCGVGKDTRDSICLAVGCTWDRDGATGAGPPDVKYGIVKSTAALELRVLDGDRRTLGSDMCPEARSAVGDHILNVRV